MAETGAHRRRSNWAINFAGLDASGGDAVFRFDIAYRTNEETSHIATLPIFVPAKGDGIQGMMFRGYESMRETLLALAEQLEAPRDSYKAKA